MKRWLLLLILLVGCADDKLDLPPAPPAPGANSVGQAIAGLAAFPAWASEPVNAVLTPNQVYFNDGVILSVSNYDYVYQNAYVFNQHSRVWERFRLSGEEVEGWLKSSAVGTIAAVGEQFTPGENYVVVYACSKQNRVWNCNNNKWMLLTFNIVGAATSEIPEMANVNNMVANGEVPPFQIVKTNAEVDNFEAINVIRYDAEYRDPSGIYAVVHVFDFNSVDDVKTTLGSVFKPILDVDKSWVSHRGHNIGMFYSEEDKQIAFWSSGKAIVYIESSVKYAPQELVDTYLIRYPSDMQK